MIRNDLFRVLCIFVALSIVPFVYAASAFPDYPVRRASDYAVSAQTDGLTIGIEPVENPNDQKKYFRTELAKKGFVPVFVVIENGSNEASFLFDKTKVTYGAADSSASTPKEGSKASQVLALSAVPFVGIVPALKVIENASQVQQNLLKKELQSTTLSPGASVHGFLYLSVPRVVPRGKIHLRVPISQAGTDQAFVFDLVL